MKLTRREWGEVVAGSLAAAVARGAEKTASSSTKVIDSVVKGVQIGVQSYSFRDRALDDAIKAIAALRIGACELWQGHVEPQQKEDAPIKRDDLRRWRLTVPLEEFTAIRRKFDAAGVQLLAYNFSFRNDFTDAEAERGFRMAQALGVDLITASANISILKRFDVFAQQYRMRVALHNHSQARPDEIASESDFLAGVSGLSKYFGFNLDLGHYVAAGFDALAFLRQYHDRIWDLHLKDRKKDQGPNVPWGEGDTPIVEALRLLRDRKWRIPAMIEYEYKGQDAIDEVRRCFDYCKHALGA
jgi:sugar phosphate isomerase/epimerase